MSISPKQQINIKLDLTQGWINQRTIELKQGDNETRFLVIRLTNVLPLNITGYTPVVFFKRADNKILQKIGQVINHENGEFALVLNSSHLAVEGGLTIEVVLFKGESKVMSFPQFRLTIAGSIHDDDEAFDPTEEEMSALWQIIGEMQNTIASLEKEYISFEEEKEQQFQTNEARREGNETTRQETFNKLMEDVQELCDSSQLLAYDIVE